jgi:hypothetical protein
VRRDRLAGNKDFSIFQLTPFRSQKSECFGNGILTTKVAVLLALLRFVVS